MALLSEKKRKEYFAFLGLGEYNEANIKKFQKMAMRPKDVDGIYGSDTDNALRHFYNVKKYTKNFDPVEFKCECGGRYCTGYPTYMKPCELEHIQLIRDHYGKPITVTSGLRCKGYNNTLAGSTKNSAHMSGYAIDFYQAGVTDTLTNRKASIKFIKTLPNHNYTYGNGINSNGYAISAPNMGNAMHTDTVPGTNAPTSNQTTGLSVDGIAGPATIKRLQVFLGATVQDGVISGQNKKYQKYYPNITSVEFGSGGSFCVKLLQKWLGLGQTGVWDKKLSKALQKKVGADVDGVFGPKSVKALQKYLNSHDKADFPTAPTTTTTPKANDYYKMIDVSEFQEGGIDWKKVKADGIQAVMIRCAGRGGESGKLYTDSKFFEYIKGAYNNGLAVGIYILTTAINAAEGKEEAQYAIKLWKKAGVPLDYPIAIDSENVTWKENGKTCYGRSNDNKLSRAKRTEAIKAFSNECKRQGYPSMLYASTSWLNNQVNMTELAPLMDVWCAQYNSKCEYKGKYVIWQYTSDGKVNGIKTVVDMNKCYIQPKQIFPPKDPEPVAPSPTPTTPTPAPTASKDLIPVALDVIDNKYGSGQTRIDKLKKKGYDPEAVQATVNQVIEARSGMISKLLTWCKKIAAEKYHYILYGSGSGKSKTCPICTGRKYDNAFGWQCIGAAFASWHHGMGLKCKCNYAVVSDQAAEKILAAKTDAEALRIAQERTGLKDIHVIRNGGKNIPKNLWQPGDICHRWGSNGHYNHTFVYLGDKKIFDARSSPSKANQISVRSYTDNDSCRMIIRYTGWVK